MRWTCRCLLGSSLCVNGSIKQALKRAHLFCSLLLSQSRSSEAEERSSLVALATPSVEPALKKLSYKPCLAPQNFGAAGGLF